MAMRVRFWTPAAERPINSYTIRRTGGQVREQLLNIPAQVTVNPRSDGPGSSQDLFQFVAAQFRFPSSMDLTDPAWAWSANTVRTPGACIADSPGKKISSTFRLVPADDPKAYEYHSPSFNEGRVLSVIGEVPATKANFPLNILRMFGLTGCRIESDPISEIAKGTGLGGSNLAHVASLMLASSASGVDLTLAQIYALAGPLENFFGVTKNDVAIITNAEKTKPLATFFTWGVSMTGEQEGLGGLQGGLWDNVHLPFLGLPSEVSRELVTKERYDELTQHMFLVNAGKTGQERLSGDVNDVWMAKFRDLDGVLLHHEKLQLAYDYAEGLRTGDWEQVTKAMQRYFDIRYKLCPGYAIGVDEVLETAKQFGTVAFLVGAGGTCATALVAGTDPAAVKAHREHFETSENPDIGRIVVPFNIEGKGPKFSGFEENGFQEPAPPEERVL